MESPNPFSRKKFAIYGLGLSGKSVLKFLKRSKVKKYFVWDDKKKTRESRNFKNFSNSLNKVDYIVMSPGINLNKSRFKLSLLKNKNKIITDLDLFYMQKDKKIKSIVVTGTNGKSTTCKLIEHILKKNNKEACLGGNIGKPILDLKVKKNSTVIIETSSFQLNYSKFVKPNISAILNVSNDHLDWHGTMNNYVNSKFKIFSKQDKNDYAFLSQKKLISLFKRKRFQSKLNIIKKNFYRKIQNKINNEHLSSKSNIDNLLFSFYIARKLGIKEKSILKSIDTFVGLPHRHEKFFEKKSITFINDSKATSFVSTRNALESHKNILWIVGGMHKLNDNFDLKGVRHNIIRAYIIGKNVKFFVKQIQKKIDYIISGNLDTALKNMFNDLNKNNYPKKLVVLFSPSSASYDQFSNFAQRGNKFKFLVKKYAKKYL